MSYARFIQKAGAGVALSNFWRMEIEKPRGLPQDIWDYGKSDSDHHLSLFSRTATIPGRSITTVERLHGNQTRKIASGSTYGEWSATFLADNRANARVIMGEWLDIIHNPVTGESGYYSDYISTIHISLWDHTRATQFGETPQKTDGNKTALWYTLIESYPISVGELSLDQNEANFIEFNVTFAYKFFQEGNKLDRQRSEAGGQQVPAFPVPSLEPTISPSVSLSNLDSLVASATNSGS